MVYIPLNQAVHARHKISSCFVASMDLHILLSTPRPFWWRTESMWDREDNNRLKLLVLNNLAVSKGINVRLKCQRCWHLSSKENGNAITLTNWNRSPKLWFSRETHLAVRPLMRSRSGSSDALWLIRCFEEDTTMFDCETVFIVFFSKALIPFEKT